MPIIAFKSRERNVPHLCSHKVLLVSSFQSDKTWEACTQQTEKPLPHNLCNFTSSLCACPANPLSVFLNIWFGMVQHQKQFGCRKG